MFPVLVLESWCIRDIPDSGGSSQVANRSSTGCLNHCFFLIKSLKKNSNEKDCLVFFPQLPTISGNYCFLELSLSKTPSGPSMVITAKLYVQQGEEYRSEAN